VVARAGTFIEPMAEDLKLVIVWALSPLVAALWLLLAGWAFWCSPTRRRISLILWGVGLGVLLVGSLPVLSFERNRAREYVYAPLDPAVALDSSRSATVVVLGTGFNPDPWLPANSQVSGGFHARLLEGVRVHRSHPRSRLVVSVANREASREEKEGFLESMVELLALDPSRVDLISEAESTSDEARLARDFAAEDGQMVVVTSAGHLPRAMAVFEAVGFAPLPAPCEFWHPREGSPRDKAWTRWVPSEGGAGATRQMLYETVAMAWEKLKR